MTYSSGASTFGSGGSGVVTQMIALGAMDAYIVKGASVTFFRFRYARHTNFAFESVAQTFQSMPQFGSTSQILLQRAGDLIYYMYVVIDLPGIRACRPGTQSNPDSFDDTECGVVPQFTQFPAYYNAPDPQTGASIPTCYAPEQADDNYFTSAGGCFVDLADNPSLQQEAYNLGLADWRLRNYGAAYNPAIDEQTDICSVPAGCFQPDIEAPVWCHWSNAIGQLLVKRARLVVGGHETDTLYSDFLYMWEELSGKAGKRLREMIGKRRSRKQLIRDARQAQRLYVPLPFWFTQTSGNALPLCTLQFHGVQVTIQWESLDNVIVKSSTDIQVNKVEGGGSINSSDLQAWLDTTYVYLDIEERNRFAMANFDQLITQVQHTSAIANSDQVDISVRFNHPIIELIWAVRRKSNERLNNHFNYTGIKGLDPVVDVELRLNNMTRLAGKEGRYYRLVQPYQHHSSIPKSHIYCYSFALYPEEPQPSGACNMSRIDNVDMNFHLQEGLGSEGATIILFGRNWNIMRFTEGLGGTLFNN